MKIALWILVALALGSFLLAISGTRILISETKVQPGQVYLVEDYGDLGEASQPSLVCRYFTGRSLKERVFWYSSNGILGRAECPFLERP